MEIIRIHGIHNVPLLVHDMVEYSNQSSLLRQTLNISFWHLLFIFLCWAQQYLFGRFLIQLTIPDVLILPSEKSVHGSLSKCLLAAPLFSPSP